MNSKSIDRDTTNDSSLEELSKHPELPKPDTENITVFTHNLPNKPILPWNHYDSPWEEVELLKDDDIAEDIEEATESSTSDRVG